MLLTREANQPSGDDWFHASTKRNIWVFSITVSLALKKQATRRSIVPTPIYLLLHPDSRGLNNEASHRQVFWLSDQTVMVAFPFFSNSGLLTIAFPITAAGPRRIFTVFPFQHLFKRCTFARFIAHLRIILSIRQAKTQ